MNAAWMWSITLVCLSVLGLVLFFLQVNHLIETGGQIEDYALHENVRDLNKKRTKGTDEAVHHLVISEVTRAENEFYDVAGVYLTSFSLALLILLGLTGFAFQSAAFGQRPCCGL